MHKTVDSARFGQDSSAAVGEPTQTLLQLQIMRLRLEARLLEGGLRRSELRV